MMNMRPAAKAQKSRTARPEGTEEMTVTIEYEAEERLEVPYEEIIRNVVEEALDYVECPYDAEVNVVLTDNEGIPSDQPGHAGHRPSHRRTFFSYVRL